MKPIREIVVATHNAGKVHEIVRALQHLAIRVIPLSSCGKFPEPVEDGRTFEENALLKAQYYAKATGKICLADDSGLAVDALDQAPGVYSARYAGENATDEDNNRKLLQALKDVPAEQRTGRFCCVLVLADATGALLTAQGVCEGQILFEAQGEGGFGYDPLFLVPHLNKTLAQITVDEKNRISHRGQALKKLAEKIRESL